jgi:hypothetical protein
MLIGAINLSLKKKEDVLQKNACNSESYSIPEINPSFVAEQNKYRQWRN